MHSLKNLTLCINDKELKINPSWRFFCIYYKDKTRNIKKLKNKIKVDEDGNIIRDFTGVEIIGKEFKTREAWQAIIDRAVTPEQDNE